MYRQEYRTERNGQYRKDMFRRMVEPFFVFTVSTENKMKNYRLRGRITFLVSNQEMLCTDGINRISFLLVQKLRWKDSEELVAPVKVG